MARASAEASADRPVSERVAVVGAGMAGLSCALAFSERGFDVTLYERDAAPRGGSESVRAISERRRGVPQAVHPHFFMGRLRESLRARHPDLLARLAAAGAGEGRFVESLHPLARRRYQESPGDAALTSIAARRTTFERVLRDYVEERRLARIESSCEVTELVGRAANAEAPARVEGVRVRRADGRDVQVDAEIVVDASGRAGSLAGDLAALGVPLGVEQHDAGIVYFTRHYELLPGRQLPSSHGLPGQIFADFVIGALPADSGTFTVTFQVYRDDPELARVVKDPVKFQALCMRLPVLARWVSPEQARPISDIFGFGAMDAYWRSTLAGGRPGVLGFFFAGDTAVRTNPRYGRGCTWAFVSADQLAAVLAATPDPLERALRYERALRSELRRDWETTLAIDRATRRRFEVAAGRRAASVADRAREAFSNLLDEAQLADPAVFRAIWTGYHGLAGMSAWTRDPRAWLGLARFALTRPRQRRALEERSVRPTRAEMLAA